MESGEISSTGDGILDEGTIISNLLVCQNCTINKNRVEGKAIVVTFGHQI